MASAPPMARATSAMSRSPSGDAAAATDSTNSATAAIPSRRTSIVPGERAARHRKIHRFDLRAELFGVAFLLGQLRVHLGDRQYAPMDRHVALDVELAVRDVVVVGVA